MKFYKYIGVRQIPISGKKTNKNNSSQTIVLRTILLSLITLFGPSNFCCLRCITLTKANSSRAANTNAKQTAIHTSIALTYDTLGSVEMAAPFCVVMVRTVRMPSEMRAGTASMLSQNETHDRRTIMIVGM